jgi:hypothetical protein
MSFSCGLAGLLLCILTVYLGAPYAFFNEIFLLIKKKIYFLLNAKSTLNGLFICNFKLE